MTTGFDYHLNCASRSCYSCSECQAGNFTECLQSKADAEDAHVEWGSAGRCSHELREVVVEPRTIAKDQYSHADLLELGSSVFTGTYAGSSSSGGGSSGLMSVSTGSSSGGSSSGLMSVSTGSRSSGGSSSGLMSVSTGSSSGGSSSGLMSVSTGSSSGGGSSGLMNIHR
jgi:hypothetical protein